MQNKNQPIKTQVIFQGFMDGVEWDHFQWAIHIGSEAFTYKTGIGYCTKAKWNGTKPPTLDKDKRVIRSELKGNTVFIHVPKVRDVLHCLFRDAEAGDWSFKSWCDEYGYSSDSLKALDIYRACEETATKLKRVFGPKYQDYKERILQWEI